MTPCRSAGFRVVGLFVVKAGMAKTLTVGILFSTTGPYAAIGRDCRDGADLARAEWSPRRSAFCKISRRFWKPATLPPPRYRLKALSHAEIELRLEVGACFFACLSAEARRSRADGARAGNGILTITSPSSIAATEDEGATGASAFATANAPTS